MEYGLKKIKVERFLNWIYIKLASIESSGSLLEEQPDLLDMKELLLESNINSLVHVKSKSYTLNCNWKVFIDNYLANYTAVLI